MGSDWRVMGHFPRMPFIQDSACLGSYSPWNHKAYAANVKCLMVRSDLIWQFAVGSALVNTGVPLSHGWRGQRPDETIVGSQIIAQRAVEIGAEIGCSHLPERPVRPDQIAHRCALDLGYEFVGHLPWHKE